MLITGKRREDNGTRGCWFLAGSGWTFWDAPLRVRVYLIDLMIKREGKREKKKERNNGRCVCRSAIMIGEGGTGKTPCSRHMGTQGIREMCAT